MTTTDGTALLRAIAAHPDEDTPRLMYADWLEEDGQPERAEFIRLQIALAQPAPETNGKSFVGECWQCACRRKGWQHTNAACKCDPARKTMRFRVAELWHQCVWKQLKSHGVNVVHTEPAAPVMPPQSPTVVVSRGFAETLYLPTLADLCERVPCIQCHGHGYYIMQATFDEPPERVPCVQCTPGDYTGKPTQLALDVMRAHPTITRVVWGAATEMLAMSLLRQANPDSTEFAQANLPDFLFRLVADLPLSTEEESADALAVAAGQWLRREARI